MNKQNKNVRTDFSTKTLVKSKPEENSIRSSILKLTYLEYLKQKFLNFQLNVNCYPFAAEMKFGVAISQQMKTNIANNIESEEFSNEKSTQGHDRLTEDFLSNMIKEEMLKIETLRKGLRKLIGTKEPQIKQKEDTLKKSLIDFTAGSLAGIAQIYISQPFDTIKVKQQTFPKLYKSMLKCFVYTYRQDGIIRGLYAGTLPAIAASIAENSVLFTAYGVCQKVMTFVLDYDRVEELSVLGNACAGFLAAFFSSFTQCPTELIKCKLQSVREMKQYINKYGKVMPITTAKLTKDVFRNEGVPGFYCGLSSTLVREMPGYFLFFGGYEATREFFVQPNGTKDDIGPLRTMCSGAVGGLASWTLTFPVDVIKTRIQINNSKESMLSVGSDILRKEGFFAFFSGLLPTTLRTIPATATLFLVYEYSKKILNEKL